MVRTPALSWGAFHLKESEVSKGIIKKLRVLNSFQNYQGLRRTWTTISLSEPRILPPLCGLWVLVPLTEQSSFRQKVGKNSPKRGEPIFGNALWGSFTHSVREGWRKLRIQNTGFAYVSI